MLFVCDVCGYAHAKPLKRKSEAPEALEEFIKEIRKKRGVKFGESKTDSGKIVFGGIRSDNEPVLRSVHANGSQCATDSTLTSSTAPHTPRR